MKDGDPAGFSAVIQQTTLLQMCLSYLAFLPLYQTLQPREDVSSAAALARAREHIVAFVVAGMMVYSPQTKPEI